VDQDRIGILGYSMGAHIAFSRAARDPRIKAIVSVAGSLPVESRSKFPPVLILQGSNDRSNPVSRVKAFQDVLKAKGTPNASRIYKGMGHNFDSDRWEDAAVRAAAFFDRHMRPPRNTNSKKSRRTRTAPGRAGDAKEDAAKQGVPKDDVPKDESPESPNPSPATSEREKPAGPSKSPESSDGPAASRWSRCASDANRRPFEPSRKDALTPQTIRLRLSLRHVVLERGRGWASINTT
jgi:hypothetical protein